MAKEKGMGKGLSALLGEDFSADFSTPSSTLPLSQIESCQNQPRKSFDQEKLEELAESIRQHGVIQPLTVRKLASGYYQIIAGERRWRAARLAGLEEIPAVVIEADDQKAMELAMIENLQREDLNPIEEAEGFRVLVETYGMTQEQAAERVGRSRSAVANALRLLDLNVSIQKLVEDGELSAGHARAILPLSPFLRVRAVSEITKGGLNVRQTEKLVKALMSHGREDRRRRRKLRRRWITPQRQLSPSLPGWAGPVISRRGRKRVRLRLNTTEWMISTICWRHWRDWENKSLYHRR